VHRYCRYADTVGSASILKHLVLWRDNDKTFRALVQQSPVLAEASDLSANLSKIAAIGLEAMHWMAVKQSPRASWRQKCLEITAKAKQQGGRCELQVVTAIEELIETTGDLKVFH
jgi:hexosaminidase